MSVSEVLCDEPGRDAPCAPELELHCYNAYSPKGKPCTHKVSYRPGSGPGHREVYCKEHGRLAWPPQYHYVCASPELSHGAGAPWLSAQQIADHFDELTRERVGYFISMLGIKDMETHWRLRVVPATATTVLVAREYSPEAVGLIEREARSRGYTRLPLGATRG